MVSLLDLTPLHGTGAQSGQTTETFSLSQRRMARKWDSNFSNEFRVSGKIKVSGTIGQPDTVGADGDTVELGRDGARSRTTEETAGKQWFLTPLSISRYPLHPSLCLDGARARGNCR